jgi:hypothetical protein
VSILDLALVFKIELVIKGKLVEAISVENVIEVDESKIDIVVEKK